MADDSSKRGPQDRSRIRLGEPYEIQYWRKKFGVTPPTVGIQSRGSAIRQKP
jgi:hypothetical protein